MLVNRCRTWDMKINYVFLKKVIKKIAAIFTEKDFIVEKRGGKYKIIFNNRFGYRKAGYSPVFYYKRLRRYFAVSLEGLTIFTKQNPCFSLINELRGYTLLNSIKKGNTIIDAGASDGFISCYFAKKVGKSGKVIALEPDPAFRKRLYKNIRLNKLKNIAVVPKALFNKNGKIAFDLQSSGASKISKNGFLKVETITLGSLIKDFKLNKKKIKLIKLDIEGGELDVIDDLVSFIADNQQTAACIASYHKVKGQPTYKEIEEKCKKNKKIFAKTIYPYHTTTFILNKNSNFVGKLESLPSYKKMDKKIWPKA